MSVEFVDTNVIVYAHDRSAGSKHQDLVALISRLFHERKGALSIQVLAEFYHAVTRKLKMPSAEAEAIIEDFSAWTLHRPSHSTLVEAIRLQRRFETSWWDSLIVRSAIELDSSVLWTEDLSHGERVGEVSIRNPFR